MGLAEETGSLRGRFVALVPLRVDHAGELADVASGDRTTFAFTLVPDGPDAMAEYVMNLLAQRDAGTCVPFAQQHLASGRLVGCTRFMELRFWRGRRHPDEVEVGGTWLGANVQRTPVNTEAKLLLLGHAFEAWNVVRLALCTDERNARSRSAIERIGGRFEGILRNHRPSVRPDEAGLPRQSAMYSITDAEWPAVRARVQAMLTGDRS